ncbi:MAG: methyltransferase domain-containing protein, partial [Sphingomonadales bacterium]|nr:methyltransferase domain-containing protein [Sphingomonadales bacterium]
MQGFALVILSRPNYPHSEAFRETAETLYFGLRRCGVDVTWSDTPFTADRVPIVFGANLASDVSELPAHAVIFNLEQVENGSAWMREPYFTLLKTHEVWDYSKRNIEMLRAMGISNVRHLALGHVPEIERIPSAPRDIDVLFYGSMNPRRQRIIDELRAAGLAVTAVFGIYGAERDALIARSRIVLNVHFYDSKIFEIVRVSYLLANGACVVSEAGNDAMEQDYADVVAFAPYDGLVARCRELLADPQARAALADRGRELMRSLPQEAFLALLLNSRGQPAMPVRTQPTILNIGSGKDWKPECINIDISPEWNPDLVYDLNVVLPPEGIRFATERFGEVHLGDESCDSIVCNDVLEHLTQLTNAMNTFVRLLKPGGVLNASVPYDLSWGA